MLGLENPDVSRWDLPANYPGLMFAHPDNETCSLACEVQLYLPQMKAAGCEFIVVACHGGIGSADMPLAFGVNTDNQGARLIGECEGIDLLITGHDHTAGYSNTWLPDRTGKNVLIVNGGGQELTRSVFRFTEAEDGALNWQLMGSENLTLGDFQADEALEDKIRPYAQAAEEEVERPVGVAAGEWDMSSLFYTWQTDSIDLVSAAVIDTVSRKMNEKFGDSGLSALESAAGLDHLDVDMVMTSVTTNGYIIRPGAISVKDIYRLYRYANSVLVLPM